MILNKKVFFVLLLLLGVFYIGEVSAVGNSTNPHQVNIVEFYGRGCPHCAALGTFLDKLEENDSNIVVEGYEVYFSDVDRQIFQDLSDKYNVKVQGVPTVFIDNKVIVGFSDSIGKELAREIQRCEVEDCVNPTDRLGRENTTQIIGKSSPVENPEKTDLKNVLTIPAVILAAIVDAINPCAFAVLIILIVTVLASGDRKKALFSGLAFSTAIFISYFLMGLGLYSVIQANAEISRIFYILFASLAMLIGLFNLKDYLWYKKWFTMEVPEKWRPKMKMILKGVTSVPGAFLVGFVISLFLLPCTSGPYIVILGLLANIATRGYAMILLLLYNLIFIVPMILITFGIYFGITTAEKMESLRILNLKLLHLIAGIIMLILGIGMLVAIWTGFI